MTWKEIPGFKTYYASTTGKVGRKSETGITELKQHISDTGYLRCYLYSNGEKKTIKTHRVIAITFLNKPEGMNEVNHIDGNKENNNVTNLEWSNRSKNLKHAFANGLCKVASSLNHNNSTPVIHNEYGIFCTVNEAAFISNKQRSNMWKELNGRRSNTTKFSLA